MNILTKNNATVVLSTEDIAALNNSTKNIGGIWKCIADDMFRFKIDPERMNPALLAHYEEMSLKKEDEIRLERIEEISALEDLIDRRLNIGCDEHRRRIAEIEWNLSHNLMATAMGLILDEVKLLIKKYDPSVHRSNDSLLFISNNNFHESISSLVEDFERKFAIDSKGEDIYKILEENKKQNGKANRAKQILDVSKVAYRLNKLLGDIGIDFRLMDNSIIITTDSKKIAHNIKRAAFYRCEAGEGESKTGLILNAVSQGLLRIGVATGDVVLGSTPGLMIDYPEIKKFEGIKGKNLKETIDSVLGAFVDIKHIEEQKTHINIK